MADDRLSSALEEIRERYELMASPLPEDPLHEWLRARLKLCREDVPRLLAALDAVLKLPEEWEADAGELDRDIAGARKSQYASDHAQAITDEALAGKLRECATELRETITRALTGSGDG